MPTESAYDSRYLAGIEHFNAEDYFEAHEAWEDLWHETTGPERRFVQALIQAAVALFHFGNGNVRGAVRLYHSSKDYMAPFKSPCWGLNLTRFWDQMQTCFAAVLGPDAPLPSARPDPEKLPKIELEESGP